MLARCSAFATTAAIAVSICTPAVRAQATDKTPYTVNSVFYVTNRAATDPKTTLGVEWRHEFGAKRGPLHYGLAEVSFPKARLAYTIPLPLMPLAKQDPAKHVTIRKVTDVSKDDIFKAIEQSAAKSGQNRVIVFTHGYNTSFRDPIMMLAAIKEDIDHPVVMFSWPSAGLATSYLPDETNAEWARSDVKVTLGDLIKRLPGVRVTLAAHSLGSRVALAALKELAGENPTGAQAIDEVILAAPDFDADTFGRDYAHLAAGRSLTLFVSANDRALVVSQNIHGATRLGNLAPEKLALPAAMNIVDLGALRTTWLGHSYHRSAIYITRALSGRFPKQQIALPDLAVEIYPIEQKTGLFWRVLNLGKSE